MTSTRKEAALPTTPALPQTGFMRLREVLKLIPISKTRWRTGMKRGQFPQPVKLGRLAFYRCEDIRVLIKRIAKGEFKCD